MKYMLTALLTMMAAVVAVTEQDRGGGPLTTVETWETTCTTTGYGETNVGRMILNTNFAGASAQGLRGLSVETRSQGDYGSTGKLLTIEGHHYGEDDGTWPDVRASSFIARNEGDSATWQNGYGMWAGVLTGGGSTTEKAVALRANVSQLRNGINEWAAGLWISAVEADEGYAIYSEADVPSVFFGTVDAAGFKVDGTTGVTGTFEDRYGNTIKVAGGLITSLPQRAKP